VANAMKQASKRFSNPFVEGSNPSGCIFASAYFYAIFHLSPAYMYSHQNAEFLSNVLKYCRFC
jgi:hypothetical protein